MKTLSLQCTDVAAFAHHLESVVSEQFKPTLALIFTSIQHNLEEIGALCSAHGIDLAACTTAGEIVDNQLLEESIAILLLEIDPAFYHIQMAKHQYADVYEQTYELGKVIRTQFTNPAVLILSGGITVDAEKMVEGIQKGVGKSAPIYGGLAGDDLQMQQTLVFTNTEISNSAVLTLSFDNDRIDIQGQAISGWEAVGGINTITEAKGNVVYGINGERAYDVFVRYFGLSDLTLSKSDQLITLQTNYPFQLLRKGGHAVLRSPMVVDKEKGSILLTASVQAGDQFRFSYSPGFEIIEKTIVDFGELQVRQKKADAVIMFSCKGRHGAFGPLLKKEIRGIYDYWQEPMVGFLTYGEIGDLGNEVCEFHNETCSLVLLKEK